MTERRRRYIDNIPAARRLRLEMTNAESALWDKLRDRRFDDLKFRRQHPVGRFVLDFYCEERNLAIEVDGGIHLDSEQLKRDIERQSELETTGVTFVRVTNDDVLTNMEETLARLRSLLPPPPQG